MKNRTIAGSIGSEIRRRILDGRYPAGSQLRQDGLATEFGASRIPVREALFQLEAEGLVRIHPHRGATVAPLSPADAAEALELRGALEPRLLSLSAPRLTAEDFARADALLEDYAAALRDGAHGALGRPQHGAAPPALQPGRAPPRPRPRRLSPGRVRPLHAPAALNGQRRAGTGRPRAPRDRPAVPERPRLGGLRPPDRPYRPRRRRADGLPRRDFRADEIRPAIV